jgi:benzoyl-CoA reductase/2-hydroxyglutaryl-CoA dehydratase subunit BcrC/BadD/HgdB
MMGKQPGKQKKKPSAQELSRQLTEAYLQDARTAREQGRSVAYTTAVSPVELLKAHDVIPIYPENHAAACLTKRMGTELSLAMERKGYTSHLCAYARSDLGYRITGKSFVFDTPQWIRDSEARREIVKYCVRQLRELVAALEQLTGRRFNYDRLAEVMAYSREASLLYRRFLDMAAYKPSPISIFDALTQMAIIVYLRGTPQAVNYYQTLCAEVQAKADQGIGAVENEQFRLYWENLPIWFKFRDHFNLLKSYGATVLTSLYVHAWCFEFDTKKDPLETLAENYCTVFSNRILEERAAMALDLFQRYSLDGSLMFVNRSCKAVSFAVYQLKEIIAEKTGTPALIFESDMGDQRFYSETQIRTRIEAFLETLQRRRAEGG